MKLASVDPLHGEPITAHSSHGVTGVRLYRRAVEGGAALDLVEFPPGGVLGRHPAGWPQLFTVIRGNGWVSGDDGQPKPVAAGEAVFWAGGEVHESGSQAGMTVFIIQSPTADSGSRLGDLLHEADVKAP